MHIKKLLIMLVTSLLVSTLIPIIHTKAASVSAVNAVLMEQVSGRVLFEKEAHQKQRIASITKIMTAILAIESGKLNDMVTVSGNAFGTEGSSLFLKQGQKMKLEDLVYGLMLRSGNDAAVAIAEHVGGSLDGFVLLMNQKAEEIGMENTSFTNPHGLDNTKNHYSTAYDMALLTRYAMNNPKFAEISGTKNHRAPNLEEDWNYSWTNKNKMLKLYKYSTGGKTGFTKLARRTLVSTAEKDGLSLIAVTLNDSDDWNDHMNLFDQGFKKYQLTEILPSGQMKKIKNRFYKNKIAIHSAFLYPLTKKEQKRVSIEIQLFKPKKSWKDENHIPEKVGKAYIMLGSKVIGQRNIFYSEKKHAEQTSFIQHWSNILFMMLDLKHNG
ncbi:MULTISPECIES: D-alanyl-D-alanine carboxypeptidase family protein [Bacillus]|uniref:D-alanyl-D-alanine carboxypeptidase family protein n=1 Tax=Bacillus TaxID=1386 RepID=UPI000309D5C2|nr:MULTISPECIES: D-alanyl-D-alanine carboxypeptidase family protein [Bacillus]